MGTECQADSTAVPPARPPVVFPPAVPVGAFAVYPNPNPTQTNKHLIVVAVDGYDQPLVWRAKEPWPVSGQNSYCYPHTDADLTVDCHNGELTVAWQGQELPSIDACPIVGASDHGRTFQVVLDRKRRNVFEVHRSRRARGAPTSTFFWRSQESDKKAPIGSRVPAHPPQRFVVAVDTREQQPYDFAHLPVTVIGVALDVGDYAAVDPATGLVVAVVERKQPNELIGNMQSGSFQLRMARLAACGVPAAVVVESSYRKLVAQPGLSEQWISDLVATFQVRFSTIPLVFCDDRNSGEHATHRFLHAALADHSDQTEKFTATNQDPTQTADRNTGLTNLPPLSSPRRLRVEQVPVVTGQQRVWDHGWLHREYVEAHRTVDDIAATEGVSVAEVEIAVAHHKFPRVRRQPLPQLSDPTWLHAEYVTKKRSMADLSRGLGCSTYKVKSALLRAGIKPRRAS